MRYRTVLSVALVSVLGISSVFVSQSEANASKLSNLQEEQQKTKEKGAHIDSNISQKDSQITGIKGKQDDLKTEISRISNSIADTDQKMQEKQQQVDDTKENIEKLKTDIVKLKERIKERTQLLDQRARAVQTDGSVDYLDVILGSGSFSELIDRLTAVTKIMNADKEIINEQKKDQAELEKKQASVEKQLESLQKMVQQLQSMKAEFTQQKSKKDALIKELGKQKTKLEHDKMSLQEEKSIVSAQQASIQKAIQLEQNRIAEEKRKQELAQKQAQQAQKQSQQAQKSQNKTMSSSSVSSGGSSSASLPPVSSGSFTRPAQGYISSEFGNRSMDADGFHSGIDIAKTGTVPIVAAADGVVFRSYLSPSYGNCIMITHSINGKRYTTVYAHMSSRLVGTGAVVSKGQQIGYMGETGEAFGQHLHFEIYIGEWTPSPHSNAVNPRNYINF